MATATVLDTRQFSTAWINTTRRRRMVLLAGLVVLISLLMVRLVLAFDMGAASGFLIWVALVALVVQPRYGLYTLFAIELAFEAASADQVMAPGYYLNDSLQNSAGMNGMIAIPMEILLLLVTTV